MKNSLIILISLVTLASCHNNADVKKAGAGVLLPNTTNSKFLADTSGFTTIKWIDSLKNIGEVPAGKKAIIKFRFKNTGTKPLFIVSAEPGCGCTVADFPEEAIAPGSEGVITANYDVHEGATGEFRKNIHVKTNTKGEINTYIFFYGKIGKGGNSAHATPPPAEEPVSKEKLLKNKTL